MTRTLPLVGLFLLSLASCKKDGAVPAYITFRTPMVTDPAGQTVSSRITDLWVYVNDQPVGVWQPGRRIPVIAGGSASVKLIAGVRRNGVTDDRIQYPFYATWQQQADLVPEQTTVLEPTVRYFDNLSHWLDDFNTGQRFDTVNCTATMALEPSDNTLTGQGSHFGRILLDQEHAIYRGVSSGDAFVNTGSKAFLEMDYRCDTRLLVGVRYKLEGVQYETAYVYLKPTLSADGSRPWNKVYIDLAEPWDVGNATDKRFYIKAELENGATSATVDVDNIRLVRP